MEREAESKGGRRICPYVKSPREDCYCFTMSSLKTQAAVYYCGGNYRACEMFRQFTREVWTPDEGSSRENA